MNILDTLENFYQQIPIEVLSKKGLKLFVSRKIKKELSNSLKTKKKIRGKLKYKGIPIKFI
jgi:hypothetical protein